MADVVRETFFSIARCANVATCLDTKLPHPCRAIVETQPEGRFQLPEPWVGRIDVAPLLFVASNPSIGDDAHALLSSSDDELWESHQLAFGGSRRAYILDGIRTTRPDGTPLKSVHYWASVRARARELFGLRDVRPGSDYALTEIVHCKSTKETGVAAAFETCRDAHLDAVLSVAAARVIVAMGRYAWRALGIAPSDCVRTLTLGGRERRLIALQHPSSFASPKTFAKAVTPAAIAALRAALVVVERATSSDRVAAIEIVNEYLQRIGVTPDPGEVSGEIARHLDDGGAAMWLARLGGRIVGCVEAHRLASPDAIEIKRLYVRPDGRRLGIANRLMDAAEAFAERCGVGRVCLDTRPTMTAALALYRARGYEPIPPYHDRSPEHLCFAKRVSAAPG
ncbi:MAG: GNAT family N-acetyltransferase [bacterium]|nr:GNAT family N-acetyltransferase [bacterium]